MGNSGESDDSGSGLFPNGGLERVTTWLDWPEVVRNKRENAFEGTALGEALNQLAQGFAEQVAIVDEGWTIVAVNDAWRRMTRVAGYPELAPGIDYRDFLKTFVVRGNTNAVAILNGIAAIDVGASDSFELTYPGVDGWEGRTLQMRINRLRIEGRKLATLARQDITDSAELDRLRERFSSSVLETQVEERRRFGRELHDSTAQLLASAGLLLTVLKKQTRAIKSVEVVDELQGLIREAQHEIRSISFLCHPPALEDLSLTDALKALARGFARRTGLEVSFDRKGNPISLSHVAESALYRTAQEGLANVHRHAHAKHIRISLNFKKTTAHLVLTDDGVGISHETLAGQGNAGVGLAGMRSRLTEIGGRLSVTRLSPGTAICASVRIQKPS